jgi:hypothetical protein
VLESLRSGEFAFGKLTLQILSEFLEKNLKKKLNFREALDPNNHRKAGHVANMIWDLMTEQAFVFLDREISHWAKRLYCAVFQGNGVPLVLEHK